MITHKTYKSTGKIIYKNDGWIVLNCDDSIVNYYKSIVEKLIWKKLSTSFHGSHVSILAAKYNGNFQTHPLWKKYDGKEIEFQYLSEIFTDNNWFYLGEYFWLRVDCSIIPVLRTELGLKPYPFHHPHLTIGYRGH